MEKIRYYLFCLKWLWKNRKWESSRQKIKRLEKEYTEYSEKRRKR